MDLNNLSQWCQIHGRIPSPMLAIAISWSQSPQATFHPAQQKFQATLLLAAGGLCSTGWVELSRTSLETCAWPWDHNRCLSHHFEIPGHVMMLQIHVTLNGKSWALTWFWFWMFTDFHCTVFSGRESCFSPDAQFGGGWRKKCRPLLSLVGLSNYIPFSDSGKWDARLFYISHTHLQWIL